MNTYFFTAEVSVRRTVEIPGPHGPDRTFEENQSKPCLIIRGDNPEQAQKFFENRIIQGYEDESSSEVEITRILAAQFVDQLFTESGGIPFDWPQINADVNAYFYETEVDDYEQGYWVDVNAVVRPGRLAPDIESLKLSLPEDVQSGVNWSPDRMYYYIVNVVSQRPPPQPRDPELSASPDEGVAADEPDATNLLPMEPTLETAELWDKEAAVLVKARNSVVAAWLWRKFAAETPLSPNAIYIDWTSSSILLSGAQTCTPLPDSNPDH